MPEEVEENEEGVTDAAPTVETGTRYGAAVTRSRGQLVLHPRREELLETVAAMLDDGVVMVLDVTAVDYLEAPARDLPPTIDGERYELVVTLISHASRERVRLRVQVPAGDLTVPSLFDIYPGAEALERETYDMFGLIFEGHPDMSRILMPDDWTGHPLRKDYAVGQIPVQFKGAPGPR